MMTARLPKSLLSILFLAPLLLADTASAKSPNVNEIVRQHVNAIGGREGWRHVQSLLVKGTSSSSSVTWVWKHPGKIRTEERDTFYSGKTLITAFDGASGWSANPFRGPGVPRKLDPGELRRWRTGLLLRSDLLDLPSEGVKLELLGEERVNGTRAYKLSLQRPGFDRVFLWIDARTFLLVQRARTLMAPWGEEKTVSTTLGDYRKVQGVMIPHAVGRTRYVVEVNAQIDDALFEPPQPLQ